MAGAPDETVSGGPARGRGDVSRVPVLPTLLPLPSRLAPGASRRPTGPPSRRWLLGLDGGATKTLAAAYDIDGGLLATGESGPSNPHAVGFAESARALREAIREALEAAGASPDRLGAAVLSIASVDTEANRRRLLEDVPALAGVADAIVTNDVVAAWASGTWGRPGLAAISGTGSNVFGVDATGASWRCGGWDYLLGDEGSGVWIGLEAMRRATRYRDGRGPWTELVPRLCEAYGMADVASLHDIVYQRLQKADIASFARHVSAVAAGGDTVAGEILASAGRHLAAQVTTVIGRLDLPERFPVALVGSTYKAGAPLLGPLTEEVHRVAPGADMRRPAIPPVGGALWLAARAAGLEGLLDVERLRALLADPALTEP